LKWNNRKELKNIYPSLKELIDAGMIEPGENVLSIHTPVCISILMRVKYICLYIYHIFSTFNDM